MKNLKFPTITILLFSSFLLYACDSFLETGPPKDQVSAENAFQDPKSAEATILGLYSNMNSFNNQFNSGLLAILMASTADDYYSAFTSYDEYKLNNITSNSSYLDRLWIQPYGFIGHANKIIEGIEKSSLPEKVKKQISGEARFARSFQYFYLVNLFNKIPLVKTTDVEEANSIGQSTMEDIYRFLIEDLNQAEADLEEQYQGSERVRPNKKTASSLLARVYLYKGDWENAEIHSTKVIEDSRYKLLDNLNDVFLKTSQEAIWQIQTVNKSTAGVNTWEGFTFVPANPTARGYYNVFESTMDSFEQQDKRKQDWLKPYTIASGTYYLPYKYKVRTNIGNPVTEYNMVLRLAEQYLIRAEARLKLNKKALALSDINIIRKRAGLQPLVEPLSDEQVALAIEKEKHLELLGEWGHRWFDLNRTKRAVTVLSQTKGNFTQDDTRIPIPQSILMSNPQLKQNDEN